MSCGCGPTRPSSPSTTTAESLIATAVVVRHLRPSDWPEVARIFGEGIATGNATFETEVPWWEAWDAGHLSEHRLVAERGGHVVGWIALAPVSSRECYAGVAEISAYVGEEARGEGVGAELLAAVVESSERAGIWTLETGVFPENEASLRLLGRFGFRAVGTREQIGRLHGVWRDVVLLERRSEVVT
jgi:L-amino acid N-acyltransferase YncA